MERAISQSSCNSTPVSAAKAAKSSSLRIWSMLCASLPCMRSPAAFTRQPLQREWSKSRNSSTASSSPKPKPSRQPATASLFCSWERSASSSDAVTSMRKSDLSCGFVSSRSFSNLKSHWSTSSRSFCTSSGVTTGWLISLKTLLDNKPLFAAWTISLVASWSILKNCGTQFVSVETSSSLNFPCSSNFCLMNMLHQRETMRSSTFCIFFWSRPRMPPTWGLARSQTSREAPSWHVTAFQAKMP
mmetsp:Transcript_120403/g.257040  ORF Transcript_120403/g.257040 Transcript_120403/m.257040 type:complete len:244 (-) Transcript_120403:2868-3599(-)